MVDNEAIPQSVTTLSVVEAQALADRLYSRSLSKLFDGSPEVRRDLCIASRAIRSLLTTVDATASRCEEHAHTLRCLQINVGSC
jgi:hypothetical protein